jgi:hypothetical protein
VSEDKNWGDIIRQEREKHIQSLANTSNVSIKEDTLNNLFKTMMSKLSKRKVPCAKHGCRIEDKNSS